MMENCRCAASSRGIQPAAGARILRGARLNGRLTQCTIFAVFPTQGVAMVLRARAGQQIAVLAQRRDVGGLVRPDDWNTLAIRLLGDSLWMLVNGQPVLGAEDGTYAAGRAG